MEALLTSIFTAGLTVFGGYFLYQRQQIWNEKRKHYEFILTELEYIADAGQQIIEDCDQEIYRMSGMEEGEEKYLVDYDRDALRKEMYKRMDNIKSKMPIIELYITDKTSDFVMSSITAMKSNLAKIDLTINQIMKTIVDSGWAYSGYEYEHEYKLLMKEIIGLRFPVHKIIKDEIKKTNSFWDRLMKRMGL